MDFELSDEQRAFQQGVRTLVQSELAGELTMKNDGGTTVHLRVPIAAPRVERP